MTSLKKFLFKDYEWEQQSCNNKKGYRFVHTYKGKWKRWNIIARELMCYKIIITFVFMLCACLFFYGSSVACNINRKKPVEICILLAFCAIVFLLIGILYFIFSNSKISESSAILQKQLILWSTGIGVAALILSTAFAVILYGSILTKADIKVLICYITAAVLERMIFSMQIKLNLIDV